MIPQVPTINTHRLESLYLQVFPIPQKQVDQHCIFLAIKILETNPYCFKSVLVLWLQENNRGYWEISWLGLQ